MLLGKSVAGIYINRVHIPLLDILHKIDQVVAKKPQNRTQYQQTDHIAPTPAKNKPMAMYQRLPADPQEEPNNTQRLCQQKNQNDAYDPTQPNVLTE